MFVLGCRDVHLAEPLDHADRGCCGRGRRLVDPLVAVRAATRRARHHLADRSRQPGRRVGLVFDVFVNGTHPLLPWLAFFCAGIVARPAADTVRGGGRPRSGSGSCCTPPARSSNASATGRAQRWALLNDDPFDRGLVYVASALGTALIAFAAISLARRSVRVDTGRRCPPASRAALADDLSRPRAGVQPARRLARTDRASRGSIITALTVATIYWLLRHHRSRSPTNAASDGARPNALYRLLTA